MTLQEYHDKIWFPFSQWIDIKVAKIYPLKVLKKLFDIHFSILTILGILRTPRNEVDCYWWIFRRTGRWKYQNVKFKGRIRMIKKLLKECVK